MNFCFYNKTGEGFLVPHTASALSPPVGSLPKLCRAQVCHSNTFNLWKPHGHKPDTDTLCDLKLNYHRYFLCKEEVPVADPSEEATDQFPWDPPATHNYQKTGIKWISDGEGRAAERSHDLSLLFLLLYPQDKSSQKEFYCITDLPRQQQYKITRFL